MLFCLRFVQNSQGVSASEMTYIVSGGALNSTHLLIVFCGIFVIYKY